MNESFNLLDERWIPVCMTDSRLCEVSLLELFEQAGQIRTLAETSPPSLIALYRLLLAITHRALSRLPNGWKDRDRTDWYHHGLPQEQLHDYLKQWRERFWLFHPEYPFMQVAALATAEETCNKLKPWTQISLASATGDAPVVFDHSIDKIPIAIDPGMAIRSLLGFLQFVPGGLVKVVRDSDKAGPLANSAASVPTGNTLNETLCLALHPCPRGDNQDVPSWEKPSLSLYDLRAEPCLATGTNDRYTRLSRAILLRNENGGVQWIRFAAGMALAEDVNAPDPMVSYRAGHDKLVRMSFRDGRVFWRDLPALLPDAEGKASHPAAVLGWAANLKALIVEEQADQVILAAGVSSNQAKLLRWRMEQVALPLPLLNDPNLADYLRDEIRRAEDTYKKFREIASKMLAETMPDPNRKETREAAKTSLDAGPYAATFFATIERDLPRLLKKIAAMEIETVQALWSEALQKAAMATWDTLRQSMGQSPPAFRAEARAYPRFRALHSSLYPKTEIQVPQEVQA
jgi:CRISPR system Cascade subunit CasA